MGFSANVMVVVDEEPAVVDCGPLDCAFDLLDRVEGIVPWERILFLAVTSARPEHLSGIEKFLAALPNVRVLALDHPALRERLKVVAVGRPVWPLKDGDFVSLGRRRLGFFHLPLPGAPEMAGVFVEPEGVLYSSDLGASLEPFGAGEPSEEGLRRAIEELGGSGEGVGPFEEAVRKALRLRPLALVPGHGPICRSSPEGRLRAWLKVARKFRG